MVELISWNMARRALWADLETAGADVALLQEAPRPPKQLPFVAPARDGEWSTYGWKSEARTCVAGLSGSIQMAARPIRPAHEEGDALGVSRRGTIALADVVTQRGTSITMASVYSAWESPTAADSIIYADASAHRLLSDLASLLTGRPQVDQPLVVAGDFNLMLGYGEHGAEYWGKRYLTLFERAEAMGLFFVGPQHPNGRQAEPWPAELRRPVATCRRSITRGRRRRLLRDSSTTSSFPTTCVTERTSGRATGLSSGARATTARSRSPSTSELERYASLG